MELMEVVSPSVAVPVLCVLVCAFLVFAFGFKSPAQPPSFDVFEDDGKKRKNKKSKGNRSQSNGHAVPAGSDSDHNTSAKQQSSSTRQAKSQHAAIKTKQTVIAEPSKKVKKQAAVKEEAKPVAVKETHEEADVEGWHTVPKKDKKQKKISGGESPHIEKKQDDVVQEEMLVAKSETRVEASREAVVDTPVDTPPSPMEQRSKKKKEKKVKKSNAEETVEAEPAITDAVSIKKPVEKPVEQAVEQAESTTDIIPEATQVKSTDNVIADEPVAPSIELQIQDAMETTVEETGAAGERKRNKNRKKKSAPAEDDFVIPNSALAADMEVIQDTPLNENTDALTVKLPKKKQKKDRSKKNDEKLAGTTGNDGASGEVQSSLSQTSVSDTQPTIRKDQSESDNHRVSIEVSTPAVAESGDADGVTEGGAPTFDEMGAVTDSWTQAKPKSKKKKARRAD